MKPSCSSFSQATPGLDRDVLVADPPVAGDELEAELADVARLDVAELRGDEVVVEQVHQASSVPTTWTSPSLLSPWTLEPLQVVPTVVVAALYLTRTRTLAAQGRPVPASGGGVAFWTGIGLVVLALNSPIDALGEEHFFFIHMTQHVILGDLAPLCFVLGLTGPILRPVLEYKPVERLRVLSHPFVALPMWAVDLYLWHIPFLYDAALHHDSIHAFEHFCFFTAGCLMWEPVVETLPAPVWFGTGDEVRVHRGRPAARDDPRQRLHLVVARPSTPSTATRPSGGSRRCTTSTSAGIVMMAEGSLVTAVVLVWLFLRLAHEGELRQQLLEQGSTRGRCSAPSATGAPTSFG